MSGTQEPKTHAEWQDAVDGAAACRAIADCKMYGLLEGGPVINIARCDQILERGRRRGVHPSRPVAELFENKRFALFVAALFVAGTFIQWWLA